MSKKKASTPMIVGISILFLVPLGIGTAITFTFQAKENEQQDREEAAIESSPFSDAKSKQSIEARPLPARENVGSGSVELRTEGIPTGTYSNPPTSIGSSGSDVYGTSRPLEDFDASTEQNQRIQQQNNNLIPDYSSPSASNNFNRTEDNSLIDPLEDNSLIDPLEDDSFLEVPESSNSGL